MQRYCSGMLKRGYTFIQDFTQFLHFLLFWILFLGDDGRRRVRNI